MNTYVPILLFITLMEVYEVTSFEKNFNIYKTQDTLKFTHLNCGRVFHSLHLDQLKMTEIFNFVFVY